MKTIRKIKNKFPLNIKSKILVLGLILALTVGFFSPTGKVSAQNTNTTIPSGSAASAASDAQVIGGLGSCSYIVFTGANKEFSQTHTQANVTSADCTALANSNLGTVAGWTPNGATQEQSLTSQLGSKNSGCGFFSPGSCVGEALGWIAYNVILKITSLILGLAGVLLNFVIKTTIVDMSVNVTKMTGINIAWKVLRDLMNMAFIFLLVYEAIKLIIGQSSTDNIKRFVIGIVMAALLINFSLFFTKVMIDASNVVTLGVYNSILSDTGGTNCTYSSCGLSNAFQQSLGLQGVFSDNGLNNINSTSAGGGDSYGLLTIGLMASVLFLITAFVFFAVSVMFVVRYIVLLFLLVLSPIAYMGMALPGIASGRAKEWWSSLWGQLLFAPIYMLMTWVVLTLLTSPGFTGIRLDPTQWTAFAGGAPTSSGSINLFFNFAIVIGLAILSLIISKKYATQGSGLIGQAVGGATKFAGNTILGGSGAILRNTVGRGVGALADNAKIQEAAAKKTGISGGFARLGLYAGKTARSATFDVRNASLPTSVIGDLAEGTIGRTRPGKALGLNDVNIPNVRVGSFAAGLAGVGAGGTKGYRELDAESAKRVRDRDTAAATEASLAIAQKAVLDGKKAVVGTPAGDHAIEEMEKALSKLSDKQVETLVAGNRELLESQNFANKISVKQLEALNKSDQFSEEEKTKLKDERFENIEAIYDPEALAAAAAATAIAPGARTKEQKADIARIETAKGRIKGLADSELEMIDETILEKPEVIAQLRSAQFESIAKNNKFTSSQKKTIKDKRLSKLLNQLNATLPDGTPNPAYNSDPALIKGMITKGLSAKDVAGLMSTDVNFYRAGVVVKDSVLTHPEILEQLTPNLLKRMGQELSTEDITRIRDVIEKATAPGTNPSTKLKNLGDWLKKDDGINNFS